MRVRHAYVVGFSVVSISAVALIVMASGWGSGQHRTTTPVATAAAGSAIPFPLAGRDPRRWKLIFSDEFDDAAATFKLWRTQRNDWIKGSTPYSDLEGAPYRSENVSVAGGNLQLRVRNSPRRSPKLTAASVNARGSHSFKYGYLEAKILVPSCAGCWPAFWMLPRRDVWPPEIDAFEYFNTQKLPYPHAAVHWPDKSGRKKEIYSSKVLSPSRDVDYTGDWHTYGVLWSAKSVQVYFDGKRRAKFERRGTIPHERMYPIIQLAVGKGYSPVNGSTMLIDHVRLWKLRN